MPNVVGLDPAPVLHGTLTQGVARAYGPHCNVTLTGHLITVESVTGKVLATVNFATQTPRAKADLAAIDGDTITAVNALLRPYGKVKMYWRTNEYRWHPVNGPASPVKGTPVPATTLPAITATLPIAAPVAAPAAPVAPVATPKVHIQVQAGGQPGVTLIATEKRHSGKPITVKAVTKTYSKMGRVILPTTDLRTLDAAWALRQQGRPAGIKITGPAGTAKTLLAQEFAFSKGVPFLLVEGQSIQTAADWYGGFVPNDDPAATAPFRWVWSDFAQALRRGTPCVILVDELNRPENERALNGLVGLMAWTATTQPVGAPEPLTLAPGILIMATINEGVEFVATVEIDAAINSRFPWGVRMGYVPEAVEAKVLMNEAPGLTAEMAKRLVRVASGQRSKKDDDTLFPSHNVISARDLIEVANAVAQNLLTPTEALIANAKSRFIPEDDAALNIMIEAQFGPLPEPLDDLAEDDDIEQMLAD